MEWRVEARGLALKMEWRVPSFRVLEPGERGGLIAGKALPADLLSGAVHTMRRREPPERWAARRSMLKLAWAEGQRLLTWPHAGPRHAAVDRLCLSR